MITEQTRVSKMSIRTYNQANSVIIKNSNIHEHYTIFIICKTIKTIRKPKASIVQLSGVQPFDNILFQYPIVLGGSRSWSSIMDPGITFTVLVSSAAVYVFGHVSLHTVLRTCVVFCTCFIIYNNILIQYVVQQDKTALVA